MPTTHIDNVYMLKTTVEPNGNQKIKNSSRSKNIIDFMIDDINFRARQIHINRDRVNGKIKSTTVKI